MGTRAPIMGLVVFCVGQLVTGCGQDTPDRVTFELPSDLGFRISTDDSEWRSGPVTVPNMVCAGPHALSTNCCSPPAPMAAVDCQQYPLACDPDSNFCALTFDVTSAARVDLLPAVELAAADGRVWSRVSLRSLSISAQGLALLPIRSALLFVGPLAADGVGGPSVLPLAPVPLVEGESEVLVDRSGEEAFAYFARDYRTPFALWLSAHFAVSSGGISPAAVDFTVAGRVEVEY